MRVIAKSSLAAFYTSHPDAEAAIEHWYRIARGATWLSMNDVQGAFSKCKVLSGERARFDLAGGEYRLVVAFDFARKIAFVKFIGTHAEYDRVDALTVSQF
jgi:mRNA interferase HigB